ncbi:coiled-coil domain-containing protein 73 isoform X3 [Numida meleagris]|nr:coiled-coil domain-containing protein 73 isoform X3 [Numida meleagris]XP_021257598.1 coiled-coil domain-containing protein 73 isoform X3 [Numida meleagris]XP_021257599.1 coiled-coil domain-containing protein 73 isoform X3 [Numida meleagris]XP_021257600.1 coiled-coil domain-containing protein 73 isoform X3 [Numida meleagris]XP_021257601.1 coiled-coil domain-containing protein 73 isoform X3 [Numida meleagris]XP_021257602.1 coiled-coil domain-containing protein 73 isoform X3 [Numida meleagris]
MDEDLKMEALDSALQSPTETLLSIRLLDFKTSLLEAIEELRIRRETEINYEDQLSKIVVEKQELEWQKETLQHQTDTLQQQNKEAMAAFKKQLQARMFAVEEEKGKYQLAVEIKEKEIDGLKETLKELQISKYALQKKLNEMDQKLQMHLTAREEHHKKLNEVERCYATIACQFGIVKGVHGKLEHSVQEAIQLNKKLTSVNERQETEISHLKEELKKVTTDLIRSKVTSQYRVGEENINLAAKEKQFQELQQKIRMETAVSKRVQEENTNIKEEKLEILSSLQCVQEQLQRITQMNVRMESELNALREEYQTLERDNELQREKAKENEEKFLNLQNEHEKALRIWKKDEENLRREIDTIKNELNALKEMQGHLKGCHPPQENQHSEQAENLHSGQEQSKDSELQTIQKENDCTPSVLRKDSNFGHEDDIEVKNTVNFSLSIEELQIEQKLRVLENSFKDEINVASPSEGKQREASPRNTLCTDTDLITQGQNSEMHVTECKGAENLGTACRALLEENHANLQQKLQDSTGPAAAHHTETSKVLLDATDRIVVCEENAVGEMNSSNQELCNTAHESFCTKVDKNSSITEHNSVLRTEASKKECEAAVCTEKNAVCERNTDNHRVNELHFGILSSAKENSQTESQKCSMLNSDSDSDNRLCRTEKSSLNLIGLPRDKYAFKQAHVDTDDKNYNDNATNIKRSGTLRCIGFPAMDAQNLLPIYRDNASTDEAAKEHSSNMPLTGTYTLCPEKIEKGVNVDDVHSKQAEQDSTEQSGGDRSTCPLNAVAMSPEKADDLEITVQKAPADGMGTDKLNEEIQTQSIKNRHSLEINDNSINNILLKHQKDLLHSTVPGRKFAEGHLKESCSLPMRTSGNLVNVSGRSSFDLSTSDKKAEKTSVRFKFLDFSSCTRVNQMRSQATWTSSSQEPSVLKEKLPCLVENKVISKALFQNVSENAARRETEPGSTSSNGAADTLNTSSMHRAPQGDPTEEWNAIAKTFYDSSFPTEHVKEGFTALNEQKSSPITVTPAQNGRTFGDEDSGPRHNPTVQTQIEEIEKFLNLERICSSRKRKYEDKQ